MNVTRYRQQNREVCVFSTALGTYDASIYGAAVTALTPHDAAEPAPDPRPARRSRLFQDTPEPPVIVTRPCLYTLRNGTLSALRTFLKSHGMTLPAHVEDLLWHQDVHFHARSRTDEDPFAVLTDWGEQDTPE